MFDQMFDAVQILSNTTKHDQTRSNNTKQGIQRGKCLVTKQCLIAFGHQTFPVWQGREVDKGTINPRQIKPVFFWGGGVGWRGVEGGGGGWRGEPYAFVSRSRFQQPQWRE